MALTNAQMRYYDHNVLRLPQDKRQACNAQVDRLITNVRERLHEHTEFRISRVIKAGSFAKHTILRKLASGDKLDVDVAFYLQDRDATQETYASLGEEINRFLTEAYPNKSVEDFSIQNRAGTVSFVGSGLDVDIVPVAEIAKRDGYGWQYGVDGTRILTCVPGQLEFIAARKRQDGDFRALVRMAKRWRNYREVPGLKSYAIELIVAHLLDRDGTTGTVEQRFRQFLMYIWQSELQETISFSETPAPIGTFTDPVVIIDPVNGENNVAGRIKEAERQSIVACASESYEAAHNASGEDDLELWKEVFGPKFRVADE